MQLTSEIQNNGQENFRCNRNWYGGDVACYIRNIFSYNIKSYSPKDIEICCCQTLKQLQEQFWVFTKILQKNFLSFPEFQRTMRYILMDQAKPEKKIQESYAMLIFQELASL